MDDHSATLGKILAGQEHIRGELEQQRDETRRVADSLARVENETTRGFGRIDASLATVTTGFEAHRTETDRRFEEQQGDIDRAHDRITNLSAKGEPGDTGSGRRRGGLIAGAGGAGVTAFVLGMWDRIVALFTSSGGGS